VLCLALESAATEALERRFLAEIPDGAALALPLVLTYEQVARQILAESPGNPTGRFLDPLTERLLVGRALQDTAPRARRFRAKPLRQSPRFRDDLADFIAELKRHKLTPEDFRERILPGLPDRDALEDLADVYQRYQELLQQAEVFDLRGLLWLALIALEEPALAASWRGRYALVLADDLQDATPLHLELLAALVGPGTEVLGAYEPAQALYRFRGAVGEPAPWLERLLRETGDRRPFSGDKGACPLLAQQQGALPAAVAETAERFAQAYRLDSRPLGRHESEGEVAYALYRSWEEELDGIGDALVATLATGEHAPDEIALLTRSHEQAQAAVRYLALRGIPVAGSAGALGEWQARQLLADVLTVLRALRGGQRRPGADLAARQQVGEALCRLADMIATPAEQPLLPALCRETDDLLTAPLPATCPAAEELRQQLLALSARPPAAALLQMGRWLLAEAPAERRDRLLGSLAALLGQVTRVGEQMQRLTGEPLTAEELVSVLAEAQAPAPFSSPGVAVLTAHQSRGRHFRLAWVAGLQEETFPAPVVISRLLSPETAQKLREKVRRTLNLPEGVLSFAGLGEAPAEAEREEQRLFYTCLTRSSERLVLSAHLEEEGAPLTPSPYLAVALPADFLLGERAAVASDFRCAFTGLAPEGPGGRATHDACPVRPCPFGEMPPRRAPLEVESAPSAPGLVPVLREAAEGLTLFPSGLTEYLRCPRRFFLGSLLKVAPAEEADVATYGSAVHAFLGELNHRAPEGRTPEEASRLLDEALAAARDDFSSPLAADLYARMAEAALKAYLGTELAGLRTTLPERYLRFDLLDDAGGRHRFGGKIDVAADLGDGVAVVDYKTGAIDSAKKLREGIPLSEEDTRAGKWQVQLPMYALAWEAQPGKPPVRRICLQNFSAAHGCKSSCVALGQGEKETETLTRADLGRFRALLVQWAVKIKARSDFGGNAPEEGCRPYQGGCPFAGICDEAELF
jgi:superfamily I DNA/RNA helicase